MGDCVATHQKVSGSPLSSGSMKKRARSRQGDVEHDLLRGRCFWWKVVLGICVYVWSVCAVVTVAVYV